MRELNVTTLPLSGSVVGPPAVLAIVSETGVAVVSVTLADCSPYVAVIIELPLLMPAVANPDVLIVATLANDEDHVGLLINLAIPSE